jgi:hypothetical protein
MEDIHSKIIWAENTFEKSGELILSNISELLRGLDECIERTYNCMEEVGILKECSECAERTGSCCGRGIENRYDRTVLLINLLMGVKIPSEREQDGCFFLGSKGCKLRAREVLCVNYLCDRICNNIEHEKIVELQNVAGEELDTLFALINEINRIVRSLDDGDK